MCSRKIYISLSQSQFISNLINFEYLRQQTTDSMPVMYNDHSLCENHLCVTSFPSAAPIASIACAKLGTRVTSISGAVLVSAGFLISIFASSVVYLYISMGLIVGELNCKLDLKLDNTHLFFVTDVTDLVRHVDPGFNQDYLLFIPFRNWLCPVVPSLLCSNSTVLPKEVGHSICYWALRDGLDLCSCSIHSAASGPVCMARWVKKNLFTSN